MAKIGEIFERIDTLMKESGKHEKDLISYLGLSRGTFTEWRRGKGDSYLRYLKEICDFFQVTPNELILGTKEATTDLKEYGITDEEFDLINKYRKIGIKDRVHVRALVNSMSSAE